MIEAHYSKKPVNGLKGISPLAGIPHFDVINGVSIDYMHNSLLGIGRQMLDHWLNSENHRKSYYLGLRISKIDENLKAIKPPQYIHRNPRSLTERAIWKANELRTWILFYSLPCLKNILPKKYYDHYSILPRSLYLLLSSEIVRHNITIVESKLKKFVEEYEHLYEPISMTYNVHLMTHLSKCVENCGPLWAYSNFAFENQNGILSKYVNGTKDVLKQISSKYIFNKHIQNFVNDLPVIVLNYKKYLNKNFSNINKKIDVCRGKAKEYILNEVEQNVFKEYGLQNTTTESYDRLHLKNGNCCTENYCKRTKFDNSVVLLNDNTFISLQLIFNNNNIIYGYGKILKLYHDDYITNLTGYLKSVDYNRSVSMKIFEITEVRDVCINIHLKNGTYVTILPNVFESD